ncbi:pyroglutamyl-peptidase I [Arthrobacter sp. Br18]|uniref:pyroglutamyl-peptidase I n=1 Tax=Arthrobacter sp. Br18 TaxID=1312954 RepID=UPI00047BE2BE|nr:pyroglutamyl-peptidase I [Arthrobacter sp. Br18]
MILLTGFEPFGGETVNPSWAAAQLAAAALRSAGHDAAAVELPCVFERSAEVLRSAVGQVKPTVVLCVGQAGGRSKVSIERVAINVDDARIPDNAGTAPIDQPVRTDGPAAYFSTLPIKAGMAAVAAAGIPVEISQTAGTYVCNHVFYALMDILAGLDGVRGGFIHVPYSTGQGSQHGLPGLDVGDMAEALTLVATAALTADGTLRHGDLRLAAGAEH